MSPWIMYYKNIEIATSSRLDTLNVFTEITKVVFILYIYSNFSFFSLFLSLDIRLFCFYKIVAQLVRRIRLSYKVRFPGNNLKKGIMKRT